MKKLILPAIALSFISMSCNQEKKNSNIVKESEPYRFEGHFASEFEGLTAIITDYDDSTAIDSAKIIEGKFIIEGKIDKPKFTQISIDGKARAFAVIEPGNIILNDNCHTAEGTANNNLLTKISAEMDSVESLDDWNQYLAFVEKQYNAHKDDVLGVYLGTALTRFTELPQIDSLLAEAPQQIKDSKRIAKYRKAAELRQQTMPGKKFTDFSADQPDGTTKSLSDFAGKGNYLLVDFWASWCPWCIKEFPQLKNLYSKYYDKGFRILGVAVRDTQEDTQGAIDRYKINWDILFNAERKPYDIYGFTGIPHLMLLAPDGVIISRGETVDQIATRLEEAYNMQK